MKWDFLNHYTQHTGHNRRYPRSEVTAETIRRLRPVLESALKTGETVDVAGTGFWLSACESDGRLKFRLYGRAPGIQDRAPISCTVIIGRWPYPDLEVEFNGPELVRLTVDQIAMAGDLERCIAWAWLESEGAQC